MFYWLTSQGKLSINVKEVFVCLLGKHECKNPKNGPSLSDMGVVMT